MSADLYDLLEVNRDASQEEIKQAYRRKARKLHPDAGGDEEAFKQVSHAYEVLSDRRQRARYDRFGEEGVRTGAGGARGFGDFGGLGDVIDAFFGGDPFGGGTTTQQGRGRRQSPGRDVLVGIELDLEEVASGAEREVEVDAAVTCDTCGGSGSASDAGPQRCATCGGSGQVRRVVRSAFGQLATTRPCADCEGSGVGIADPCPDCGGEGRRQERRTLTAEVPPGVEEGDRLRISGAGEAGRRGASTGDLYVEVHVRDHDVFRREGRDLACEISVPFVHAALGAAIEVPTINGDHASIEVPRGTQPGDVITVRRAGIPRRAGHDPGDLHVRVQVEVPKKMSDEEEELLRRLAEIRDEQTPPTGRSLFERLRQSFGK